MRVCIRFGVGELEQHRVLHVKSGQLKIQRALSVTSGRQIPADSAYLVQRGGRHDDLAPLFHVVPFIPGEHGHGIAFVGLLKGTIHVCDEIKPGKWELLQETGVRIAVQWIAYPSIYHFGCVFEVRMVRIAQK